METIAISKFKATCLAVLERVRKTRQPVLITRFGQPVAEVVPPSVAAAPEDWIGSMRSSGEIKGNIIDPAANSEDWEALLS